MNEIQVINEQDVLGKEFKVYGTFEEPLFLAKDVAEWIDYAFKDGRKMNRDVSKMLKTVDDDEKLKLTLKLGGEDCSHGGIRENVEMWFLTESGLYEVLMQSRKPIAKQFKKEVKKILKDLRTGKAKLVPQLTYDEEMMLQGYRQVINGDTLGYAATFADYGEAKKDEGKKEIVTGGIISQKDIVELIRKTYPNEFYNIPFDVIYKGRHNCTYSLFNNFLIDTGYIYKDYAYKSDGITYEKKKSSFPTDKFSLLIDGRYAYAQKYSNREKYKLVFYGTIEELIKTDNFRLAFFQWAGVIKDTKRYEIFD